MTRQSLAMSSSGGLDERKESADAGEEVELRIRIIRRPGPNLVLSKYCRLDTTKLPKRRRLTD